MVFELVILLAVLGLGFVFGRIWEIRRENSEGPASAAQRCPSTASGR